MEVVHKKKPRENKSWCGRGGVMAKRWDEVTCDRCLNFKSSRLVYIKPTPVVKIEDVDILKLKKYFNK
jgi:ribosomal protein S27AE